MRMSILTHKKKLLPLVMGYWVVGVISVTQHNAFSNDSQALPRFLKISSEARKGGQSLSLVAAGSGKQLDTSPQPESEPEPEPNYDPCSHPFHSWLCQKPRAPSTTTEDNFASGQFLAAEPISTTPPTTTTTTTTPKPTTPLPRSDGLLDSEPEPEPTMEDICNHPFHSFLCQKTRPRRPWSSRTPPPPRMGSLLFPDVITTSTTTTTTTTTTPAPTTTTPPPRSGGQLDSEPQPEPQPEPEPTLEDICNHPFHNFLCQKPKPRKPWSSPTTSTTTTPPPVFDEPFQEASFVATSAQVADPQDGREDFPQAAAADDAAPEPEPEPWNHCEHPALRWRCEPVPGRGREIISFINNKGQSKSNEISQKKRI